ncbi:leucine-rich repeat domain-containing protein [Streptomyces hainanensis]|uniref:Disease resistance R13L4/SHOC-2-like LRR domain-containing protein n=1 Tax=Streptomyces hainanensis TaxID=402648 RepID=A0A4R4TGF5_9ACTN|nr:leucine-rich repeat domain-containing protein [Streptomyces hainanensis]TDC74033.1 hypothetical protein E1283_17145 [Streptomyces hainanensis]
MTSSSSWFPRQVRRHSPGHRIGNNCPIRSCCRLVTAGTDDIRCTGAIMTINAVAQEQAAARIAEAVRSGQTSVSLRGLGLTALPASLLGRTDLTTVDLSHNHLTELPDTLDAMAGVTDLDLASNRLQALPDTIGGLTGLTRLNLNDNYHLDSLPPSVAGLADLTDLDLGSNRFTALPEWLGGLTRLVRLDASSNQLTELPAALANLTRLERLGLSFNTIGVLPGWVAGLTAMTDLHLSYCGLTALPEWIGDLTALNNLGLDSNGIAELPDSLDRLTALTYLWLEENQLTALPVSIGRLHRLEYLSLRHNRLSALPDSIGGLTNLVCLTLDHNALTALPVSIGRLHRLETFYLTDNRLTVLPDSIGGLTALNTLPASGNALTALPESIGDLSALTDLQLSGNQLARLPERVSGLTALTRLGLGGNHLTSLPESIGRLTALTELNLANNRLTGLPPSISELTGLTTLDVYGNDLTDTPATIVAEADARVSGDPSRYRYARAPRTDLGEPAERRVELALRSATGITGGPIPQDALDAVDGLRLRLRATSDFSPLSGLRRLRWLSIESSVPLDVTALVNAIADAKGLTDLSITAPIADITPLARLGGLRILRLDGTQVVDVSPLAGMPLLQVLGLGGCPVRDLAATATMPALHFVNLNRCEAAELGDLPERLPHVTFEHHVEPSGPTGKPFATAASDVDTAALLVGFRNSSDFHERWDMLAALLATRDPEAIQEVIRYREHVAYTVSGLFFRDGVGDRSFAANPWGIEPDAGWSAALDRVWALVADHAPNLTATIRDRTLALALLTDPDGRAVLAYLAWRRDDNDPGPIGELITLEQLADPGHDSYPDIVLGAAPRTVDRATELPVLAGPVPRPVRDFWSAHACFGRLHPGFDRNMLDRFDGRLDEATDRLNGLPPDRFVDGVGGNDYQAFLFDLDVLDDAGYPTVACWSFKDGDQVGGHESFWDWVNGAGIGIAFY